MRHLRYLLPLLLLGATVQVKAQEQSSGNPALADYKEVRRFREVLYPLLEKSLPALDYEVLLNAAPVLQTAVIEYSEMEYKTRHNAKHKAFDKCRDSLSLITKTYVDAALQFDSATILTLLPPMQEQFEKSAALLIPYSWPEYVRLRSSTEELRDYLVHKTLNDSVIPTLNPASVVDTIVAQAAVFVASPGPQEVQYRASLIAEEQAYITKLVGQIKSLLSDGDMEQFRIKAAELEARLVTFERYYLQ